MACYGTPELILQCYEGETDVLVNVGMGQTVESGRLYKHTVQLRFDDANAYEVLANEATDSDILILSRPISTIKTMLEHDEMLFGFTPYNAGPDFTVFDIRGLDDVVVPLREACSW